VKERLVDIWFWLALGTLLFWLAFGWDMVRGNRSITILKDVDVSLPEKAPRVSVIIAARNEEAKIEQALQSVLGQDYPNLEFIVINDRSDDRTGEILQAMGEKYPALHIVDVSHLPEGWLGKNHALYCGAQQASGDYLLFADADVMMQPATISKALSHLLERDLDHLTIGLEVHMPGLFLEMFIATFAIFFAMYARPWKASDPKSSCHIGIGGFNLVRSLVYWNLGGHRPIAMRPDDDMKLGKLIKKKGYRQEMVFGRPLIHVEWYDSVGSLIHGLEKNAFAGVGYSSLAVIAGSLAQVLVNVWPFVGIFVTSGPTRWVNILIVGSILVLCWDSAHFFGAKPWHGVGFPVITLFFLYILWRAMLVTLVKGGVHWRGTFYPLDELRANRL
jgi:hypothetical protein